MDEKTVELKKACAEIFRDMAELDAAHRLESCGFHFSYSTEDSWRADTKVLVLTLNPQARDAKTRRNKLIVPDSPWPEKNAFLDASNPFGIKMDTLLIFAEIARHMADRDIPVSYEDKRLREFVDTRMVLASYVPFRTNSKSEIAPPMWEFAKEQYWNRILGLWQPELVITVGADPFTDMKELYSKMGWDVPEKAPWEPVRAYHDKKYESKGTFRFCTCTQPASGAKTLLLGVPHPAYKHQNGGKNCGYQDPEHPGLFPPEKAPVQLFLRKMLAKAPL